MSRTILAVMAACIVIAGATGCDLRSSAGRDRQSLDNFLVQQQQFLEQNERFGDFLQQQQEFDRLRQESDQNLRAFEEFNRREREMQSFTLQPAPLALEPIMPTVLVP